MTAHPLSREVKYGTFENSTFDNGRIKYEIHGLNAVILTHEGNMLVENVHPEIWINNGGWKRIDYNVIRVMNYTSNGTHRVVVEAEHKGEIYSYFAIMYEEKTRFSLYSPLFPKLFLTFNKSEEYKVSMVLENIKINHFLVIDNGSGYTEPPFKEGHGKHIIYNGTIKGEKEIRSGQDIVIGYSEGKKMFGLNWESYKEKYKNLKFNVNDIGVNMAVESDPENINSESVQTLGFPIPDTGGGGGGGGGTPPADSDGDGLSDDAEVAGWYAYWYDSSGNKHTKFVTSSPYNADTDSDGVNDYTEWEHLLNPQSKDTDGDGMLDDEEVFHGVWNGGWQDPHRYNHRYAVIIVGGGYMDPYNTPPDVGHTYAPAFWNDGLAMYNKLINDYHYSSSNVYLLSSRWYAKFNGEDWAWRGENPSTDSRVYGETMWDSSNYRDIKDALDEIGNKITVHDSLMIVIIAHGGPGGFTIRADVPSPSVEEHPNKQETGITYEDFGSYLNSTFGNGNNKKYAVMIVIAQVCFSGTMMSHLRGENRILISAADSNQDAYTEGRFNLDPSADPPTPYSHWAFIYEGRHAITSGLLVLVEDVRYPGFIKSLGSITSPESVYYAFEKGYGAATNNYLEKLGSGIVYDGRSNPQINDATYAGKIYL